ncbi:MAG: hypothetical protein ACMXYD_02745 [Candidatus Woesearchaeota archaeon]
MYYEEDKTECDFLIKEATTIVQAIQVSVTLADKKTKQREIQGILDAMNKYELTEATIITKSHEETIRKEKKTINVIPLWKFLLEET